ncbi:MAG: hypothetical protein ACJ8DI_10585 [Ktedonobacteraceae bacterium]
MQRFFQLERVIRRAPLGMRFVDIIRDVTVSDSLLVQAWQKSTSGPKQTALVSPISGVHGFRSLPDLTSYETGERPASDWCASPGDATPPDDWASSGALNGWVNAAEGATKANFIVTVQDLQGRFLPELLFLCLPREALLEVPLFSSPARTPLAGFGVIRGQLIRNDGAQAGQSAGWARITAILGDHIYEAIADARGIFVVFVPYARFPALQNGGAGPGGEYVAQLTWDVTIQVSYQPTQLISVPGVEQPDMRSIIEQERAKVYQQVDQPLSELKTKLPFGRDLVVTTGGQKSLLFVDPALP